MLKFCIWNQSIREDENPSKFKRNSTGTIVWAFAKADRHSAAVFDTFKDIIIVDADNYHPTSMVKILWAYSRAKMHTGDMFEVFRLGK